MTANIGRMGLRAMPVDPPDGLADRELWKRVAAGDEDAFAQIFRRHLKALWNYANRLTGSAHLAEDITSATFLTAWRKRKDFVLVSESVLPWLYTVAGNLARDEYKSSRRRLRLTRRVADPVAAPDHAQSVVDQIDRFHPVVTAIQQLPTAQRRAAELCLLGELPQKDAAAILGVAEVTLRSTLSRAKARLRDLVTIREARQ
ncbi:RNA polymerase sigma factor [Actinocrispum wychmicini]|uniref:RNA polymerase sigma-70 factor (ECF subfamily) n=1 Tax=Actinocrispum wychmicini TaxID=1213861 RepID=A0A4R2K718_9PSEU|nr:sigma-70 family RNA polymerase sigma factor [Actinocrispum wychmicini]TCO65756.1 RNA polymerase sigma-70 factor (ECF subfamily) [Actinocrispum wychmicini]